MSHLSLQRVMVRMLYDAEFTRRVLEAPDEALAGLPLTEEERGWLRTPDPRAWRTDPERTDRSVQALLQQYPASVALAVRASGDADPFTPFLRSQRFHEAIQTRGSLALAFADHLADRVKAGDIEDRRVLPMVRLERAIVELHRSAGPWPPASDRGAAAYRLSSDKRLHVTEGGTADLHEKIHRRLARSEKGLVAAVLDGKSALPRDPVRPQHAEPLLLELARDAGPRVQFAVGTTEITQALYDLLTFAQTPRPVEALVAETVRLGADPEEAPDVVRDLIEDGTLA